MTSFTTTQAAPAVTLAEAVLRGLGTDGALYVPATLPNLASLPEPPAGETATVESLQTVATWVAPAFFSGVDHHVLQAVIEEAFTFPIPLVEVERGRYVLELFHGPTHAFKDVGARFMAALMRRLSPPLEGLRTILVATSGDTGGAVASAFHGVAGVRVVVLFPGEGVSDRQRRQMTTLGGNVQALAVSGSFDDCQRLVRSAFADEGLRTACQLTSANSINIARLLPQAFYYVHAAAALGAMRHVRPSAPPVFVVPSGNLGNLCAGLLAHRAGMPCERFVAASNRNRGFVDYLEGAPFHPRESVRTSSNAMDVGVPSNFERIRWLYHGVDAEVRQRVRGEAVTDEEGARCIERVHRSTGYVLDPHSAVAYEAASRCGAETSGPIVVLATAHPAKFPEVVEAAIGETVEVPHALAEAMARPEHTATMSADLDTLTTILLEGVRA